jgi:hypothetical protein
LHLGPPPELAVARHLPRFAAKHALRFALDRAPPNFLLSAALTTPPMRWLARHIYFHRRGAPGLSFADFEARLADLAASPPARPVQDPTGGN